MIKRNSHKILRSFVVLMAVVVMSPLLLKPLHVFLHDDASHGIVTQKHQAEFSQKKEDCPACDFHFFFFLDDISYQYKNLSSIAIYSLDGFLAEQNTVKIIEAKLGRGPPEPPDSTPHLSI